MRSVTGEGTIYIYHYTLGMGKSISPTEYPPKSNQCSNNDGVTPKAIAKRMLIDLVFRLLTYLADYQEIGRR